MLSERMSRLHCFCFHRKVTIAGAPSTAAEEHALPGHSRRPSQKCDTAINSGQQSAYRLTRRDVDHLHIVSGTTFVTAEYHGNTVLPEDHRLVAKNEHSGSHNNSTSIRAALATGQHEDVDDAPTGVTSCVR